MATVIALTIVAGVPARAAAAGFKYYGGKISSQNTLDDPIAGTKIYFKIKGGSGQPNYNVLKTGLFIECGPGKFILGWGGAKGSYIANIFAWCAFGNSPGF